MDLPALYIFRMEFNSESESVPKLFGRNVRKFRKAARLTQEQLSERLGISQKHLSTIETGTQFASAQLIEKISNELEIPPADLFGGSSGEMKSQLEKMQAALMTFMANELNRHDAMMSRKLASLLEARPDVRHPFRPR